MIQQKCGDVTVMVNPTLRYLWSYYIWDSLWLDVTNKDSGEKLWAGRTTNKKAAKVKRKKINSRGKFILSPQEQRRKPRFKVLSEGLSPEIDILIRSPIQPLQVLPEAAVA